MERKKWLLPVLIVLMVIVTSTANAQFRFGIKGGVNISTVKFDKDVLNSENITGFHIGPVLEFMPDAGIGLDMALLYSRKGFYSNTFEENFKNDYLEVPVNLKCKIGLPLVSPYFAAGPYVSFRIAGNKEKNSAIADGVIDQIKTKSFGAGLNFTAGVEVLNKIQVGLTYDWGLTDNYETFKSGSLSEYKGKPHTWMISAALMF